MQGDAAETLEKEVKDLREKNYRKSIMLRDTISSQQQLQAQLTEKVRLFLFLYYYCCCCSYLQ